MSEPHFMVTHPVAVVDVSIKQNDGRTKASCSRSTLLARLKLIQYKTQLHNSGQKYARAYRKTDRGGERK